MDIEMTPSIREYVEKKVNNLEKYIEPVDPSVQAWVEVAKTTNHHHKGNIFGVELQVRLPHVDKAVIAKVEKDDLYAAIDEVHDEMKRELTKIKGRKISLIKRGGRMIKKILRLN